MLRSIDRWVEAQEAPPATRVLCCDLSVSCRSTRYMSVLVGRYVDSIRSSRRSVPSGGLRLSLLNCKLTIRSLLRL